ncbi:MULTISPECIES: cytochrome c-type biogenesis protein [Vibrio]|uniref:Cytochrome c-type biogenesis protein n=1 Tax=Vibrio algicola TaxID=2662262 RepID=A0A5Q0TCF8_9VIBR|nr:MULTISPECIES: cytochrome c-type biogenesis protein [Vibrio]MBD1574963.1 cytochrome c-type biogenesis protein CcmH [Vibrio sp. S11_S32]
MKKLSSFMVLLLVALSFPTFAAIEVFDFDTPAQEAQFQELSHTLRCPKCQNNSISDSNAELAKDLREKTYLMTKQGKSKQEIIDYMVARYGNFVTYNPPLNATTAILWVAPLSIVLFGFAFIFLRTRRRAALNKENPEQWDDQHEQRLQQLLSEEDVVNNDANNASKDDKKGKDV